MTKKKFGFGVMAAGAALLAAGPVMAHPGGHHTHLWSTGNESVKVAEVVPATPLPSDLTKVSGQGDLQFKLMQTSASLPAKALDGLNAAHGGFAVDRREGKGEIYFALPQVGIIRIANDLNTIEILPTDAEMATKNMHNSKIWVGDNGQAYLTFPGTDSARVWTTTDQGALVNILEAPTADTPFDDATVSAYFDVAENKFVPTDVDVLDNRFYIATGYSALDYVLTADVKSKDEFSSAWNPFAFGGKGDGPGQFGTGHGITVAPDGKTITVADRPNSEIESFTKKGKHLGALPLPKGSLPCDIDYQSGLTIVGCLEGPDKTKGAPIYIVKDGAVVSTVTIKDDLGLDKFVHIHNAVMVEKDEKFYIIAQAWNPGDFAILEQVK